MSSEEESPSSLPHIESTFARFLTKSYGDREDSGVDLEGVEPSGEQSSPHSPASVVDRLSHSSFEPGVRYVLEDEIAQGGMGAIFQVFDTDLRRRLAMKVMLDKSGSPVSDSTKVDPAKLGRFLEEAQVTGQLDHPGVVPVHELGVDQNGRVYFTMQLVRGRTFKSIIEELHEGKVHEWNLTRALTVVLRVCEAMAYAHHKRVVHRDLKPANVMVGRFGEVYVMDWGLARVEGRNDPRDLRIQSASTISASEVVTDRKEAKEESVDSPLYTMDGAVIGTPFFMPPEQAGGRIEDIGQRSDVYSLGAMLYHLLTGTMPYYTPGSRPSPHTILAMVLQGPPKPVTSLAPSVPAELVAICEKAMAREISDRYGDMSAFAEDLRAFLEHRVVRAYRTGAFVELSKWVERNRGMAAALVVAFLIAVFWLAHSKREAARSQHEQLLAEDDGRLAYLELQADDLWPANEVTVPAYELWLEEAGALIERIPEHEARHAKARSARSADLEKQRMLVEDLLQFRDPVSGLFADIMGRLAFARTVEERTLESPRARDSWSRAIAAIRAHSDYGGLDLAPQLGLLPLGPDPHSGLWEFAHVQSGTVPERGADGALAFDATSCIVLVLIPGGEFHMGSQAEDEHAPGYDPDARGDEGPVVLRAVEPFFLSKFEMTQSQWSRLHPTARYYISGEAPGLHPAEMVDWAASTSTTRKLALSLPTETQWEYAARAGTTTPWWTGAEPSSLASAANVADAKLDEVVSDEWLTDDWYDGFAATAPVGSLEPNRFGLHDVLGNVWEWCSNWKSEYSLESSEPVVRQGERLRPYRGGSWKNTAYSARCAYRYYYLPDYSHGDLGLRPARELDPPRE